MKVTDLQTHRKAREDTALERAMRLSLGFERMLLALDELQGSLQRTSEKLEGVRKLLEETPRKPRG